MRVEIDRPRGALGRWVADHEPAWAVIARRRIIDAVAVLRGRPVLTGWTIDMEPHAKFGIFAAGDELMVGPAILTPRRSGVPAHVTCNVVDGHRTRQEPCS